MRALVALALAGLLALVAGVARPDAAVAACVGVTPAPGDAVLLGEVVFVGTVTSTENLDRWANVRVEERWRGATDLPSDVQVQGGPETDVVTSLERTYLPGRYLFVVRRQDGLLVDDPCSGTRPWSDDLAAFRPAGVEGSLGLRQLNDDDWNTIALAAGLIVLALVAVVLYLYVLRARRRPPDWMR